MGDPVAIMGVVGKGIDPFGKPVPCISPMLEQELPEAYYQLLKMTESERQTLLSVQVDHLSIKSYTPSFTPLQLILKSADTHTYITNKHLDDICPPSHTFIYTLTTLHKKILTHTTSTLMIYVPLLTTHFSQHPSLHHYHCVYTRAR